MQIITVLDFIFPFIFTFLAVPVQHWMVIEKVVLSFVRIVHIQVWPYEFFFVSWLRGHSECVICVFRICSNCVLFYLLHKPVQYFSQEAGIAFRNWLALRCMQSPKKDDLVQLEPESQNLPMVDWSEKVISFTKWSVTLRFVYRDRWRKSQKKKSQKKKSLNNFALDDNFVYCLYLFGNYRSEFN